MTSAPSPPARPHPTTFIAIAVALLGIASAIWVKLAIPAMTLGLLAFLSLPRQRDGLTRLALLLLALAAPAVLIGLVRFTVEQAIPGVVEGSHRYLTKKALWRLREIRFAQDFLREQGVIDPDKDGVGSAATLEELAGNKRLRGGAKLPEGLLKLPEVQASPVGPVVVADGYVFAVFLPTKGGGATARADDPIDDERAERRFVAYAWPLHEGPGEQTVIFLDEHERILLSDNQAPGQRYFGLERAPRFDAALSGPTLDDEAVQSGARGQDGGTWTAWREKQPRERLPGDR